MSVLLNKKTVNKRKNMRKIAKRAIKIYGKHKGGSSQNYFGKLVENVNAKDIRLFGKAQLRNLEEEAFLEMLKNANLQGMSGNGFCVHKKISSFLAHKKEISYLVINAVECEPGLVHDEWILEQYLEEIMETMRFLQKLLGISECRLATKKWRTQYDSMREIQRVPATYPMGEEHVLIQQMFGHACTKEWIPAENGFLVMNVQTIYQIYRLLTGTYDGGRYITVANLNNGLANVSYVVAGEKIGDIIAKNKKQLELQGMIYAGSGILAAEVVSKDYEIDDTVCLVGCGEAAVLNNENKCKGCGRCSRKCPMGVSVKEIVKRREKNPQAEIKDLGIEKCLHCNCCTFVCSAGKNLSEYLE